MIADMHNNKKLNKTAVNKLFITIELNIFFAFITQSYSKKPKIVGINTAHFFITKIPNKG